MAYVGGAAGVGVALGLLFGMMLDQGAWGVVIGAVVGVGIGAYLDRTRGRRG